MLRYDIVDVFADRPFAGNPLAVVHDAADLSFEQCLAVAREFNLSETTFPVPRNETEYDVRIFTPAGELPFAGHPTLGTAWVLREKGLLRGTTVTQHCGAGEVPVRFTGGEGGRVELAAARRDWLGPLPRDVALQLANDLGLSTVDLVEEPTYVAGTGLNFVHLQVHPSAIALAWPMLAPFGGYDLELSALGRAQDPVEGINLFAVDEVDGRMLVRSRVFVPGLNIPEDPGTGSAATGLGQVLVQLDLLPDGGSFEILQGVELGRPSRLSVRVEGDVSHVSGPVWPIASGQMQVP
jgi:trans-2,3-dihydro-3-hydroxyanthranilate isomerase